MKRVNVDCLFFLCVTISMLKRNCVTLLMHNILLEYFNKSSFFVYFILKIFYTIIEDVNLTIVF